MDFVSDAEWAEYKDIINDFNLNDSNQQPIVWRKLTQELSRYGEDDNVAYTDTTLLGLVQYNYFRSWPTNKVDKSGEIDKESTLVFFNIEYLRGLGYVNADGQFQFDAGKDRFLIDGVRYKPSGNSKAAQASNEALLTFIILSVDTPESGETIYG